MDMDKYVVSLMAQTTCMSCVAAAAAQAAAAQDMGKQTRLVSYIQAVK